MGIPKPYITAEKNKVQNTTSTIDFCRVGLIKFQPAFSFLLILLKVIIVKATEPKVALSLNIQSIIEKDIKLPDPSSILGSKYSLGS